ncbi:MAG: hypothetical protein ACI8P0_001702 [Planctomycetaceae bacterium]|jgi:hypothetical protein
MKEAGVDLTGQSSRLADSLKDVSLDLVVTECGQVDQLEILLVDRFFIDSLVEFAHAAPAKARRLRASVRRQPVSVGSRRNAGLLSFNDAVFHFVDRVEHVERSLIVSHHDDGSSVLV